MRRLLFFVIVLVLIGGIGATIYLVWIKPDGNSATTGENMGVTNPRPVGDDSTAETPATGTLVVDSEPAGVDIKLDGIKTKKQTPATFANIDVGPHVIELSSANVYRWWLEAEVTADGINTVRALLVERDTGVTVRASQQPTLGFMWQRSVPEQGAELTRGEIADLTSDDVFVVSMIFDPGLDPDSISSDTVGIYDVAAKSLLKSSLGYIPTTGELMIKVEPADQITESGTYQVILDTSLADVDGEQLGTRVAWTFGKSATDELTFFDATDSSASNDPASAPLNDPLSGALSNTSTTTATQRDTERRTELAEVARALEAYLALQGHYPRLEQEGDLVALESALAPNLITALPFDPSAGTETTGYRYQSAGETFTLKANLESPANGESAVYTLYDAKHPAAGAVTQ